MKENSLFRNYTKQLLSSNIVTMFSLSNPKKLLRVLSKVSRKVISTAVGKTRVAPRLRRFNKFVMLLIKFNQNHGTAFTIKWLKACHLAVQRKLSSRPCRSLRDIEPNLPCPRLINGLPTFIGTMDRKQIRSGHAPTIRLWLSILSIYRILKGPLNPKLNTITDKFEGSSVVIDQVIEKSSIIYSINKRLFKDLPSIQATRMTKLLTAGPNGPVSIQQYLTDAIALAKYPEVYEPFRSFAIKTKSFSFMAQLDRTIEWLYQTLTTNGTSWVNISSSKSFDDIRLGKLSFKEEAAGKLRVFAIADIWTQSLFNPLHKSLFAFLRRLPNDGTFDQDASFERSMQKAQLYNCAYSVDLSAATDRLPILLQAGILDIIFNIPGLGKDWASILVDRPYFIDKNKYGLPEGHVYYGTGQPMGALSSWAMLAVTHHFILQVCAHNVYTDHYRSWYSRYEILGDDLVIFDTSVYQEYLRIMDLLKVGTNPSKSLFSEDSTALEFAKRTGLKGLDVSGLSWKQFISCTSLSDRISLLIHFARKGLVSTIPMMLNILGTGRGRLILDSSSLKEKDKSMLSRSLMALLGHFVSSNKMTLVDAVAFTADPHDEDMDWLDIPTIPITVTLHESLRILNLSASDRWGGPTQLSQFSERQQLARDEVTGFMADSVVRDVLSKLLQLCNNYDLMIDEYALSLVAKSSGLSILRTEEGPYRLTTNEMVFNRIQMAQIRSFAEWVLLGDEDPQDLHDQLYSILQSGIYPVESGKRLRSMLPSTWFANEISLKYEALASKFKIESNSRAVTRSPIAWLHKDIMNAGSLKSTPYWILAQSNSNR